MKTFNIIKGFLFICLISLASLTTMAQSTSNGINEMKVGFLTEELALSKNEAQQFWPVYNEYQDAKETLRNKYSNKKDDPDAAVDKKEAEAALLKKYNTQFKKVLPSDKVAKLHKAESKFKKMLLDEYKKRSTK